MPREPRRGGRAVAAGVLSQSGKSGKSGTGNVSPYWHVTESKRLGRISDISLPGPQPLAD